MPKTFILHPQEIEKLEKLSINSLADHPVESDCALDQESKTLKE